MLKTVVTGLAAYTLIFVINSASASAATLDIPTSKVENDAAVRLAVIADDETTEDSVDLESVEEKKETKHVVKENETLTSIAEEYDTTWQRLFDKNESIDTPDLIEPGVELDIPDEDEELEARELPQPPAPQPVSVGSPSTSNQTQARPVQAATAPRASTKNAAGNSYVYGYCTWHVKNLRPDLPSNLGNANTWAARARAQGFATGSTPRVGAVAQATTGYMHVAYVTGVNKDGTVTISEMNYRGWGVVSSRTAPASSFTYIY